MNSSKRLFNQFIKKITREGNFNSDLTVEKKTILNIWLLCQYKCLPIGWKWFQIKPSQWVDSTRSWILLSNCNFFHLVSFPACYWPKVSNPELSLDHIWNYQWVFVVFMWVVSVFLGTKSSAPSKIVTDNKDLSRSFLEQKIFFMLLCHHIIF